MKLSNFRVAWGNNCNKQRKNLWLAVFCNRETKLKTLHWHLSVLNLNASEVFHYVQLSVYT